MNTQDRRRLLGPANAKPLKFTSESEQINVESTETQLYIQTGLINNANGSSYLESKSPSTHTLLNASVYGPRPIRGSFTSQASLNIQFKESTIKALDSATIKELTSFLKNVFNAVVVLERYPKSGIDIFINLVQHLSTQDTFLDIVSSCVNAVSLALIDAGIEIVDVVAAGAAGSSCMAFVKNGEECVGCWNKILNIEQCMESYKVNHAKMMGYLASK